MIGEEIGNFRIVERLGKGGMGEVWLAQHRDIKTRVAIKMLLPSISSDRPHVQRFFNEAIAVSKIKHAGIVKIFDVGFHKDTQAFLVMEYLDGESLAARIRRLGRLPLTQIADVGLQLVSVLDATHSEEIIHRDLKPENIFIVEDAELSRGERVKVLDFGIAKLGDGIGGGATGSGSLGTPAYMSPEQWRASAKVDGRADLYSLGCVLFEMACGRPPFRAASLGEMCDLHLNAVPPRARSLVATLPEAFDNLLAGLLEKQPEARPLERDIRRVLSSLVTAAGETVESSPGPIDPVGETRDSTEPRSRRSRARWLAVAGGVALAAVAGTYLVRSRSQRHDGCSDAASPLEQGRCLAAADRHGEAIAVFRGLEAREPKARLELGELYAAVAQFPLAADKLEQYAHDATDDDAMRAMRRAAAIRAAYGEPARSVADLRYVIDSLAAKNPTIAADARIELAAVQAHAGDRDGAIAELRHYVEQIGETAGADRLVIAQARLAQLLWQRSCPGDTVLGACITVARPDLTPSLVHQPAKSCGPQTDNIRTTVRPRTPDAQDALAVIAAMTLVFEKTAGDDHTMRVEYSLAKLCEGDSAYEALLAIPPAPAMGFDAWFGTASKAGEAALARYTSLRDLDGHAQVLAAARMGQVTDALAHDIEATPIPENLRSNETRLDAFCDEQIAKAKPFADKARTYFAECAAAASGNGLVDDLSAMCMERIADGDPKKFSLLSEVLPEPRANDAGEVDDPAAALERSADLRAYIQLALSHVDQEPAIARLMLDEARRRHADDPALHNAYGIVAFREHDSATALAEFQQPDAAAELNLALLYLRLYRFEDARAALRQITTPQFRYEQLLAAGVASRGLGNLDEADQLYAQAIAADPRRPEAYFAAGVLYKDFKTAGEKDLDTARALFETAMGYFRKAQERGSPQLAAQAATNIADCARVIAQLKTWH